MNEHPNHKHGPLAGAADDESLVELDEYLAVTASMFDTLEPLDSAAAALPPALISAPNTRNGAKRNDWPDVRRSVPCRTILSAACLPIGHG